MKRQTKYFLAFLLLNLGFTLLYFWRVILNINTCMLAGGGDGGKNYFNYLYYINNDKTTHFTGQNYPYGENIVFTDNMPALAWPIAKLKAIFPGVEHYGLGIMHAALILSFFVSAILFYKILRFHKVEYGIAIVSALFMAYCSPQFIRIFGHFGLAMIPFFPIVIYSLMKFERKFNWTSPIIIMLATILFSFFHVYFLGFAIILIVSYSLAALILKKHMNFKAKVNNVFPLWLSIGLAAFLFKLYLFLTDAVIDRPKKPFGFHDTVSKLEDYLTTDLSFLGRTLQFIFWSIPDQREGFAFIGFTGVIVFLYLIYRVIKSFVFQIFKHKRIPIHPVRKYRFWLVVTLFIFLYSLGIPFVWHFDFVEEYLSNFQQFRTMGRFSWMVFYLFSIYVALVLSYLFSYLKKKDKKNAIKVLSFLLVLVFFIDWNGYRANVSKRLEPLFYNYDVYYKGNAPFWDNAFKKNNYKVTDFQAILAFPFYHVGSEKAGLQNDIGGTFGMALNLSINTNLPIIDVMMSRTSWGQTFKSLALVDGPFSYKKYVEDLPNDKPVILMVKKDFPLNTGEQFIVNHAHFLDSVNNQELYVFNLTELNKLDKRYTDSIVNIVNQDNRTEGILNDTAHSFSYVNHLDNYRNKYSMYFLGKGALEASDNRQYAVDSFIISPHTNDTSFLINTWFAYKNNIPQMPYMHYELYDKDGNCMIQSDYLAITSTLILDKWALAERIIEIPRLAVKIKLWSMGGKKEFYALDEILLHPANTIYFYKKDGKIIINNRIVN